jgi:hypothetical protein
VDELNFNRVAWIASQCVAPVFASQRFRTGFLEASTSFMVAVS